MQAVEDSKSAMDYLFSKNISNYDKDKVGDKKRVTKDLLEMIGSFVSEIEKSHWIKKLGEELETSESALTDMLKKVTLKDRIGKREEMQMTGCGRSSFMTFLPMRIMAGSLSYTSL